MRWLHQRLPTADTECQLLQELLLLGDPQSSTPVNGAAHNAFTLRSLLSPCLHYLQQNKLGSVHASPREDGAHVASAQRQHAHR